MRVEEHRILAAAQGALAGAQGDVRVDVHLHTSSVEVYAQLCDAIAGVFDDRCVAGRVASGRYVQFTPLGDSVYPSLTIHLYEGVSDGDEG